MKKKIFAVLMLALLATACSSKKVIKNTGVGVDSANKYAIEDTEASKKPLEDIIVFDQEGVTIRREGNNLILSMPELILFDFDKYAVKDGIKPSLATLAKALGENKDIHIKIDGYTDFIGTEAYNLELSVKRARAIKDFLIFISNWNEVQFEIICFFRRGESDGTDKSVPSQGIFETLGSKISNETIGLLASLTT